MKPAKSSTRKVRNRSGKLSTGSSSQGRRRPTTFKLESLEERVLLSLPPITDSTTASTAAVSTQNSPIAANLSNLSTSLINSIEDINTVATVAAPSTTGTSLTAAAASAHIYTGQPETFVGPLAGTSTSTNSAVNTSNPGQYNPDQQSQAALLALAKSMKATPQYFVISTGVSKDASSQGFSGPAGYAPAQVAGAYGINQVTFDGGIKGNGAGQTIAIVDAGDYTGFVNSTDPNFDSSALHYFDTYFGLPDPPSFTKYNQYGQTSPLPSPQPGWGLEISLDVEWSHAMAPDANIELVEASNSSFGNLGTAAYSAAALLNASVVSQSFGGYLEYNGDGAEELALDAAYYQPALNANPNVTFLAATGDGSARYGPIYPSISPLTVAVGGTSLYVNGQTYSSETAWSGGGGGPSNTYPLPTYQQGVTAANYGPLTVRTAPDVAAVANPNTGVSVYDPVDYGGWVQVGGTSVATPITSATIAIADQGRVALGGKPLGGPSQTLPGLYAAYESGNAYTPGTGYFNDITVGDNGYEAGVGYDLTTGIGSEQAENLLPFLALYELGPAVTSSDPAQGQVVTTTPPTDFSLTFNEPIVPSSVVPGDFTVNGVPADSDTLSNNDETITYSFTSSPVVNQGLQTMELAPDSVLGAYDGQYNHGAFIATFYYVTTQLQVASTSPPVGSVYDIPSAPGTIDLVVTFNEAVNPYAISTSDFQVNMGTVASAVPLTPESVDLTIDQLSQDGFLTLTLPAGALTDQYGVPGLGFTGTYVIDIATLPYTTPLAQQPPAGSLIYDPSVTGAVGFGSPANTNTFTLPLAAGQTLSLALTPDSGLTGTVTLEAPGGTVIGTATGSGPGSPVVLEAAPITTAGTYTIIVGASGGTSGTYSLQAILNAIFKPATLSINTIGTAYDLSPAFQSLGTTPSAEQAGIVGTLGTTPSDFYAVSLTAGELTTIAAKGTNGTAALALYDSNGNLLTYGTSGGGVDSVISDFVAQTSGTYYVNVTGSTGLTYDVVETLGADFDLHGSSFDKAQPLNGADVVLGAIIPAAAPLYTLDDNFQDQLPIWQTSPTSGAYIGSPIYTPSGASSGAGPYGLNLAFDGTNLYFNAGEFDGNNTIYELNPTTGAVINTIQPASGVAPLTGIAWFEGHLWGSSAYSSSLSVINTIYEFDSSGNVINSFATGITGGLLEGLAGDPDDGVLWTVTQTDTGAIGGTIYEINPTTGAIITSAKDASTGYEQDIGYFNGELFVSDAYSGPGSNYLDVYSTATLTETARLPIAATEYVSGVGADGLGGSNADWYQFNVNAGDSLTITTTTPGAPSGSGLQFPNDLAPTLDLYDASGNLVASATGNAPDGINDILEYVALTPGSYRLEILGSSVKNLGEYTISIQGATGGLNPFQITSTNPAAGSDLGYQVSTLTATFSSSVLLSSISDSDFTIDGIEATSVTLISANTVEFTFPTTSDGVHNVTISGVEDLQGTVAPTDSFSFTTDDVPPTVVSSSIADGAVLSPGPLTEVITFSKPIQPSSANDSDILLYAEVRGIEFAPSSISFDPTDTILTITYANLPSDAYQFILEAGPNNFLSDAGVPLQSSYVINFTLPVGTTSITGLQPVLPLGSLVYESTIDNALLSSTDVDTYDLTIDPKQTLAVIATPVSSGMKVTVTLISPAGIVIGTATSPTAGAPAVLPGVQSSKGGTYEIVITGGPGEYTVEPVLNAYVDPASYGGASNGSIASATPIDPYANSFAGSDSRTAVLGSIASGGFGDGDVLVTEFDDVILIDQATGDVLERYTSPDFSDLILFDVALAKDNTFYVLGDYNDFTGVIVHMNLQGATLGEFTMPVTDSSGYLSPEGFGYDPRDGSFWVPLVNSATLVHVDSNGNLLSENSIPASPDDAAVGPDGNIYTSQIFSDYINVFDPNTDTNSYFAYSDFPANLTWSASGNLFVGAIYSGIDEYNSSGTQIATYGGYYNTAGEPGPAGNVWAASLFDEVYQYAPDGAFLTSTFYEPEQSGVAVLGDVPGEEGFPSPNSPYYSFELNQGESASIVIQSLNDTNVSFTLLDDEGNILGYGGPDGANFTSGLNNFVAPDDGTYYVEVTGDSGSQFNLVVTRGADFNTQPNNQFPSAQDITATELSGDNKLGGVLGYLQSTNGIDYYSVNVNAGDNLAFTTTTPAGGPGEFINTLDTELLLFDANGNLVAIAAGNASDGRNSVIDFTVPSGDAGTWTIAVTSPDGTFGEYGLLATGATGALSPFDVTSTTPSTGALIQPPTDIFVTFNEPVAGQSLTPGELEVNGVSATAVTLVNAYTVDWSVPASAFPTGVDLPNVVTIGADAYGDQVTDVSGQTLTPFSYSFFTTNVAPVIVSSSVDGQVFSPAPADVTEVVTFSQPMDTSFTTSSSFSLYGNYTSTYYAAASYSWDPTGTILTINYDNLPNDSYTLTLFASGFENIVGIPLASNYVANFSVALGTASFTGTFKPVNPLGSLIYTATEDPVLVDPTDVDYLTLSLNAGETLTLLGVPTSSDLQLWLTVLDPNNNVVAYTEASAPGADALIETAPAATTGTYTIVVYDVNGNVGQYSIQATLNAFVKTGTSNDTIATAQDLTGTSYGLGTGGADRLAALGSLPSEVVNVGDVYVSSRYYGYYYGGTTAAILRINSAGEIVQTIPVPEDTEDSLSGVELDPVNNMLYAAVTTSFNGYGGPGSGSVSGELVEFNPITGQEVATIPLPVDNSNYYYYYPYGFSIASDGSFWIPQPNSGNIIHLDANYNEIGSYSAGGYMPESASIGTDGNVYFSTTDGDVYQLNPSTDAVNYFAFTSSPFGTLTNTAPAGTGIWAADYYDGGIRFDYNGNFQQQVGFYGTNQVQTDQNGDVWDANSAYYDLFKFDQYGDELSATFVPGPIGLTIWGVDNPNPPAQDTQDYYSFSLNQGQTATAVVDSLNGKAVQITIVDGNGDVLATGVGGASNVSQSIEDFVAPSTGTYYVEVTGDPGVQYSMVVTRGADFTLQPHNSYSTAQNLTGTGGVLGYLAPPSSPLFVLDDQLGELGNAYNPIYPTDPATGAFTGPAIFAPGDPLNNPFGLNMAYDGTYLYYNDGGYDGDNEIYKIDPTTGDVIAQGNPGTGSGEDAFTGLAYLDGSLYGSDIFGDVYQINPNTFTVTAEFSQSALYPLTGLAGDADNGELYAVSQENELFEIDPTTGAVLNEASIPSVAYEQDLAYAGGLLIVSEAAYFGSGGGILQEYDPTTLDLVNTLPVATQGYVAGLGGDGLGGAPKDDWYSVDVQAGQSLSIQSFTPSDQGGQFPNTASLEISLYDTYGDLVAQGVKLADGRNESLFFNAPVSGEYRIDISEDPGGQGEYFLQVNTASYPSGSITGQVYNDLNGSGTYSPSDPGLEDWEVDLFDSNDNFVGSYFTDANGDFNFGGLDPGTYTVEEDVLPGWTQTAPPGGTFTVTVTAGGVVSGLQFGNFQDVTVSGEVFDDLNENGNLDPSEPGLQGWTIDLYDASGDLIATTTTDVNGDYSFSDLGPGTYTVQEVIPAGWVQTFPAPPGTYTFTASSGLNETGLNFGNYELVTYTGTVYNDLNGSGVIAPGDPGLAGWTIELLDSNGNILETTTSASDGSYSFADLGAGTYTIEEINQAGWYQTEPQHPFVYTLTATSGSSESGLNFGNFQLVNVYGNVYNDLNGNGNLDPGEPGLQGWTVILEDQSGNTVATTTSDANGNYEFDSLFPGNFIVVEVLQSGWTQTQPLNPDYYSFATQSGTNETGLNFGNFSLGTFSGTVYNDQNGDGIQEPYEPGLAGWTVDLLNSAGGLVATTTSGKTGQYSFGSLEPGVYTIEEIVKPGWYITQPTNPPGTYTLSAESSTDLSGLSFGNFKLIAITGGIYDDLDGNGLHGSGEPGLSGWTVDLEDSSGNVLASALTDSNGNYSFTDVGAGSYEVAEVVPTNWVQTQPLYPTIYSFNAKSGVNLSALVFGDHASPALDPDAVIDNGQPGYAETGTWSTVVGGFNGTNRVAATTHGSVPTATASWSFSGLAPSEYEVYITYAGKGTYSTAAPFSVLDSGTTLGTVDINESILVTQSQGGLTQGSYGGVGWLELGEFTSSDGSLEVLLSNEASGRFVDADGVLLVPVTPSVVRGITLPTSPVSVGVLDPSTNGSASSTKSSSIKVQSAAPTISISGVSAASAVHVVYNQGSQPSASQSTTSLIDAVLGVIDGSAKDLISGKKNKS